MVFYDITLWRSLTDTSHPQPHGGTWSDLVQRFFADHAYLSDKFSGQGFGPYSMVAGRNDRKDSSVHLVTLAVFDADIGTIDDMEATAARLDDDGVAQAWYSSYSHRPERPSYRLVVPLARPVKPEAWRLTRAEIIRRYAIPCDPGKCQAPSHFYFLPACPIGAKPEAFHTDGVPLDPPDVRAEVNLRGLYLPQDVEVPEDDPTSPVDMGKLRERLQARYRRLARTDPPRGELLGRVLDGKPLADSGSRNVTTTRVCGMLAWTIPDAPISAMCAILRPSVEAMVAEGSSIGWPAVQRMLESARREWYKNQAQERELSEAFRRVGEQWSPK